MSRGWRTRRGDSFLTTPLAIALLVALLLQAPVAAAEPTPTPTAADPATGATPTTTPEPATPTATPTAAATPTPPPTPTAEPTPPPTPAPTATEPASAAEPQPTATPEPTPLPAEPQPTATPEPTPTPESPPPPAPPADNLVPPPPAAPIPTPPGLEPADVTEPITEPPPASDPNLVVPAPFNASMTWSEEGAWHWVEISHDGTRRFWTFQYDVSQGKELPFPYFVATRVRTLQPSDPCGDCVILSNDELGPPSILGGPENPALAAAYANLENGPRRKIADDVDGGERWTYGSWYLNYSPLTGTFFSWTWIPDDWTLEAKAMGHVPNTAVIPLPPAPQLAGAGPLAPAQLLSRPGGAGGRVWPIAGAYRLTQAFGCVPQNDGYETASFCPPETPSFHNGVDLAAPAGTTIVAAASGTVTFAGADGSASANSLIVIRHDGANAAFQTEYLHWQRALVQAGDVVQAGQPIAEVGSIGYSTGPHLHFVVKDVATGASLEPLQWLNGLPFDDTALTANVLRWQPQIAAAAAARNVPAALIAAIITVESAGNPEAVSPAGAVGLMQIMPDELTRLGVPQELWQDPAANIDAGARYLAETLDTGASPEQAVAVYFGTGCDVLGTCTDAYVERVMQWFTFYTDQLR